MISLFVFVGCNKSAEAPNNTNTESQPETSVKNEEKKPESPNQASESKTFTVEELKKYDGQNGNPAYVAINGKVYDVTNVKAWRNGKHKGFAAGNDLSEQLKSAPHGENPLGGLKIVGTLKK